MITTFFKILKKVLAILNEMMYLICVKAMA